MKRFLMFTLTLLFTTTCSLLTDLQAFEHDFQSDTKFAGNVYGSTYVCTGFDFASQTAHSSHSVAVDNYGIGPVKLYAIFRVEVHWNGGSIKPPPVIKEKRVPKNGFGSAYHNFSFPMRNKRKGHGYIQAWTDLEVLDLATTVKLAWPTASCITFFDLL